MAWDRSTPRSFRCAQAVALFVSGCFVVVFGIVLFCLWTWFGVLDVVGVGIIWLVLV